MDQFRTGERPFLGDYSPVAKQIKELPRKTSEERREVKKKIVEVREGISFERAVLAQSRTVIEEEIVKNPQVPMEQLVELIKINQFPAEVQKAITGTIDDFRHDRKGIDEVNSLLRRKADHDKTLEKSLADKMGQSLYQMITHQKPSGGCEIKDSVFGVWLIVYDDDDFKRLDSRNIGGYYQSNCEIKDKFKSYEFPLIVTKSGLDVIRHEEAHGQHSEIKTGMWLSGEKFRNRFWGKYFYYEKARFLLPKTYLFLKKYAGAFQEKAVLRFKKEGENLLEECRGRTKDELLAELYNPRGDVGNMLFWLQEVRKPEEGETEQRAVYDWLSAAGLQKMENHEFFGEQAKQLRRDYYQSLQTAARPLISLVNSWNQAGIDKDKLRRRFVYGQLLPERLEHWAGYLKRSFGSEITVLKDLNSVQRKVWQKSSELKGWAEEYADIGLTEAAQEVKTVKGVLDQDSQQALRKVEEAIKTGRGEIDLSVFQTAFEETDGILKKHQPDLEKIGAEREKLEAEIKSKMNETVMVKTLEQLKRDGKLIETLNSGVWVRWEEQLVLAKELSVKLGVPIYEGVFVLEYKGEIPDSLTLEVGDDWRKVKKTFDFSGEKVREAVKDIATLRASLNLIDRLTISNSDLRKKIENPAEHLETFINTWYSSVFRKYQTLSVPLGDQTRAQIKAEQEALQEVQAVCAVEFEKVTQILAKYKSA